MDFSVINEFPSQSSPGSKQITVIHAENGSLYEYPYIKFVSPIGLKRGSYLAEFVEKEYGVSKANQFILRSDDGKLLDNNVTLEDFFRKDTTIYVFVLKGEANQNIQDDFEVIGGMMLEKKWSESILQILPTHYENLLGRDVKDMIEPQSIDIYNDLMALFCDIKTELNSIKDGTIKLKRQKNAEEVAKKNLFNYFSEKKRKFDEILGGRESQIEVFQGYLNNFDKYIEKLSTKEIDPQLGEEDKKYLIDYFDVEKLRKSKATYEKNQVKIKQKSQEIKENIVEYDNHLKKLEDSVKDNSGEIHMLLGEQENLFADIQSINLQGFKQLVEDKKGVPSQKDLSDFIKRENETSAPKLREIHQELRVIKEKLEDQLKENAGKLKRLVSDIMNLRVIIKSKIYNKLKVFCSIVDKHAEQIFNLEIIESFPKVYEQSLGEIRRRTGFKKDYLTVLNILESFAQSENKQRQEFLEMYQQFLPKSFCPFLSKTFPQLNFDHIRRMIDQDLNTEMNDFIQYSNRASNDEAAETLRLIKNLTNNVETKEKRMNELAESLQKMHEENETLKGQLKHKLLNVDNMRKLLGETNFEEKVQEYAASLRDALVNKVSQLEKRVADLQNDKFAAVKKKIAEEKSNMSACNSLVTAKLEGYEAEVREREEKVKALNESLAATEKSKAEVLAQLEQATAKLEKAAVELKETAAANATLEKELETAEKAKAQYEAQKSEVESQLKLIGQELEEAKKNVNSNKESGEKKIAQLASKLQATEVAIREKTAEIEELKIHLEETNHANEMLKAEVEELQHHLSEKTAQLLQKEEELSDVKTASEGFKKDYENLLENFDQMRTMVENAKNGIQKNNDEDLKKKDIEIMKKEEEILKKDEEIKKKDEEIKIKDGEIANKNEEISKRDERIAMKNEEVKLLKEKISANEAKLGAKEDELNKTMKDLELHETELSELRDILQQSMDVSMVKPANNLLGELGNGILSIYAKLNGENDPKIAGTLDIQDALNEIAEIIEKKMVKIEDLQAKDKAIAVKLPNKKEYLVLNNLLDFILNIYTPDEKEDLGDVIIGEIESISPERDAGPLKNIYKQDVTSAVITVLKNTRSLSSIRFSDKQ